MGSRGGRLLRITFALLGLMWLLGGTFYVLNQLVSGR
jgi:hypothetical protein